MRVHLLTGSAAKDDVSSQASARELPPAPQGSPQPSDPLFQNILGWLAASGGLVPRGPLVGTQP